MSWLGNAAQEAKNIPWWAWAGGGLVILFVGKNLLSGQQTDTGQDTTNPATVGDIGSTGADTSGLGSLPGDGSGAGTAPGGSAIPPTATPPGKTPPAKAPTKTYTVKGGDTLGTIAARQHVDEPALYSLNASVIEATARSHGFSNSDDGHWIFPGEVLKLPA